MSQSWSFLGNVILDRISSIKQCCDMRHRSVTDSSLLFTGYPAISFSFLLFTYLLPDPGYPPKSVRTRILNSVQPSSPSESQPDSVPLPLRAWPFLSLPPSHLFLERALYMRLWAFSTLMEKSFPAPNRFFVSIRRPSIKSTIKIKIGLPLIFPRMR